MSTSNRRRQVRFSYPIAIQQLAALLAVRYLKHAVARCLGIPLSTIYRWHLAHAARDAHAQRDYDTRLIALVDASERHGLAVRDAVHSLTGIALATPGGSAQAASPSRHESHADVARWDRPSAANQSSPFDRPDARRAHPRTEALRRELTVRYYERWTGERFAQIAGVSKWHVIRMFKARFGVTPYQHLIATRLAHAKVLLATTTQPLDSIASAVGFDTASSFCKAFRNAEGTSPAKLYDGMCLDSPALRRAVA